MFRLSITLFVIGAVLISASVCSALSFSDSTLSVSGKIVAVIPEDIDGDGKMDLAVSYTKGLGREATPAFAVFFATQSGYPLSPDIDIALPKDSCLLDLGDLDGDGRLELVLFRKWKVQTSALEKQGAASFHTVLEKGSGVMFPSKRGHVPYQHLVQDWFGDNTVALALPDYGRLTLYRPTPEGLLKKAHRLNIKTAGWIRTAGKGPRGEAGFEIQSGATVPSTFLFAGQNNKSKCLVFAAGDELWYHPGTETGFAPNGKKFSFSLLTDKEKQDANMDMYARVLDLNADGYPEAVLSKFGGSILSFHSEIRVYRGTADGFSQAPDYVYKTDGYTPSLLFEDADGDGAFEIMIPWAEVGLTQIARILISQSAKVEIRLYPGNKNAKSFFASSPSLSRKISFRVETEPIFRFIGYLPDLSGDFNGDGFKDLAMASGKGLGIWISKGGRTFSEKPSYKLNYPPQDRQRILDLDGDGRAEFLFWDELNPKTAGKIRVVRNVN
jgi:hypothetical protein